MINMFSLTIYLSLSSVFKILNKLYNTRLDAFIEKQCILSNNHYGFRSSMSTSLALFELTEEITIGVFTDLKKAFNTRDHELLLSRLNHYGIANDWPTLFIPYIAILQHC